MKTLSQIVYEILASDDELSSMLAQAKNPLDGPAIYDFWADPSTEMPYIVFSINEDVSVDHWAKQNVTLTVDIFAQGPSKVVAEKIKDRVETLFDMQIINTERYGPIRCYLVSASQVPEETIDVVHLTCDYVIQLWRKYRLDKEVCA